MIIAWYVDKLIRAVNGGVNTVDSKWEPRFVQSAVAQLRERAMKIEFNGSKNIGASKRIDYAWYNPVFTVDIDDSIQDPDTDYIIFSVPKPVQFNKFNDGLVYVGEKNQAKQWSKATSRSDISNMIQRGFLTNGKDMCFIWVQPYLQVYGNKMISQCHVQMVCANPLDAPNFNELTDDYPISESLFDIMIELWKQDNNINISKPADIVLDNAETLTRAAVSANIKS